ncbi:MAG: pitrilysin family protein [Thermoanaerobaculia bacterium]
MSRPIALAVSKLMAAPCLVALSALFAAPLLAAPATPAPAAGATAAPAPAGGAPEIQFEKYTLPNGLQVILHVDRKLPIVHVNEWFHVGSKNEKPGRTGFAHLFEHLMFQGSKNVPGEYFSVVEELGANIRQGGVNGTTNNDRTNYFATVPSGNLEKLLWVESDRLATLVDVMDQAKLDNQRDVVKNERRQSFENQPYGLWPELLANELFPFGHPYSWSVIGSMADLSAASLDDVKDFFRTYYTPNNLSLVIAGDFDPATAKQLVEKYFGSIPPGPALARPKVAPVVLEAGKTLEIADRVPQERVYMIWPSPETYSPGDAELDLAALVLTDGLSSRLTKALVYDSQKATTVNASQFGIEIANAFVVIVTARPGVDVAELETLVAKEIAKLAASGPTLAELDRAKNKLETQYISGLERIGGFGGKADLLNQYNTYLGDPGRFSWDLARWRNVTPAAVQQAVKRYLDTDKRLTLRFRPENSARSTTPDPDRTQAPAVGAEKRFVAPQVATRKLANGLEVYVVERRDLPKVAVQLTTRAGIVADPVGKEGTANLALQAVDLGTAKRSALEIEAALGDLGTTLVAGAGREGANLQFEVLTRNVDAALGIVADVVRNPTFPQADFDREKQNQLANLEQQSNNPNTVAGRVRNILTFGREHPYGRPSQGLPSTVASISRDDVARFWSERVKPASSVLVFVGGLSLEEAAQLAEKHFGSWNGGSAPEIAIGPAQPAAAGKIYLVDRQDAAQTVVSEFLPAPAIGSVDDDALTLADSVYGGGGFGTRLNLNLREDKGYSYGVFSSFVQYTGGGIWYGGGGVQTDKTAESVVEFVKELKGLAGDRPITAAEFEGSRLRRLRGMSQQYESYGTVAGTLATLWLQHRPLSELQAEPDRIATVPLAASNAAAAKWARPEKSSIVVVGDRGKIEAKLRALNLGEVVVLDVEGRPVAK